MELETRNLQKCEEAACPGSSSTAERGRCGAGCRRASLTFCSHSQAVPHSTDAALLGNRRDITVGRDRASGNLPEIWLRGHLLQEAGWVKCPFSVLTRQAGISPLWTFPGTVTVCWSVCHRSSESSRKS